MGHADEINPYSLDAEATPYGSQDQLVVKPLKSWKCYIWDTWELPQDQRWLLFKIGCFVKNLDQFNVNNAFLSGMEEDLEMYGNQLVTSTSIWIVGYVLGQIPSNLLLTRVSPRWVIPSLELFWGIATICTASVKSYKALYAIRFLVGLCESGFYPGIHYILVSWYTPQETGKRPMMFWLAGTIGQLFSGFLQAAAYKTLNGVDGHAGWRWLFIIDGIITLPLAVLGFIFIPNLPKGGKKTWWTTDAEHKLSIQRMQAVGRAGKEPWSWAKVKRISLSWHTYFLPMLYVIWNNGGPQVAMGYWLKSFNHYPHPVPGVTFTVPQINNLPLTTTGIFIVMAFVWGWLSDGPCRGSRWPFIYLGAILTFGAGPLILSWVNEIYYGDTEKRALLVAAGNDLAYVVQAVAPNFVWKITNFPAAKNGYLWSIVLQVLLIGWTAAIQLLLWRYKRNATRNQSVAASQDSDSPELQVSDLDEKEVVREDTTAI